MTPVEAVPEEEGVGGPHSAADELASAPKGDATHGSMSAVEREVARSIVALHKRRLGRGPSSARAYVSDAMVTVLLTDVLTRAERTLLGNGRNEVVRTSRNCICEALETEAALLVEAGTGRRVAATMAAHSLEPDYATFTFVLSPAPAT